MARDEPKRPNPEPRPNPKLSNTEKKGKYGGETRTKVRKPGSR